MTDHTVFIGLDTHKDSIAVAIAEDGRGGEVRYRLPARVSSLVANRQDGLPKEVRDIAWKAQVRLCQRFRSMRARGKNHNLVVTAIAREMACFLWAIARTVTLPPAPALAA